MGTVASGAPIRARMTLQEWLEKRGAPLAFICAATAMIARGALMWSGGAFDLAQLFGARVVWFNAIFGLGIAVGAELSGSIAGRGWRAWLGEIAEAREARGLSKQARADRVKSFRFEAWVQFGWMMLFMFFSTAAAAYFAIHATNARGSVVVVEIMVAAAAVAVVTFLSVFNITPPGVARELREAGHALHMRVLNAAMERIARGDHSPADIRVAAGAFPRADAQRFTAAFLPDEPANPTWGARDVARLFGGEGAEVDPAIRKLVGRRLKQIMEQGGAVTKTSAGAYQLKRDDALRYFADDFLARLGKPDMAATLARPRERSISGPLARDRDTDARAAGLAQPRDTSAEMAAAVAG